MHYCITAYVPNVPCQTVILDWFVRRLHLPHFGLPCSQAVTGWGPRHLLQMWANLHLLPNLQSPLYRLNFPHTTLLGSIMLLSVSTGCSCRDLILLRECSQSRASSLGASAPHRPVCMVTHSVYRPASSVAHCLSLSPATACRNRAS